MVVKIRDSEDRWPEFESRLLQLHDLEQVIYSLGLCCLLCKRGMITLRCYHVVVCIKGVNRCKMQLSVAPNFPLGNDDALYMLC